MTLNGELSPISRDAIMQSEYVVREKLLNNKEGSSDRFMFFRVEAPRNNKEDLVIRQLSKLNPTNSLLERYRVFVALEGDVQKKESYRSVKTEYFPIKFPEGNAGTVYLSITFPKAVNEKDKSSYDLKREGICHRLDLTQLREIGPQLYGNVYKLKFNEYAEETVVLAPDNNTEDNPDAHLTVSYKSFVGPEMKAHNHFYCNNPQCNGNRCKRIDVEVDLAKEELPGSCYNQNCKSKKSAVYRLVYECEDCGSKYCPSCKFGPYLKDGEYVCTLGHPVVKSESRQEHFDKTGNLQAVMCEICLNTSIYQTLRDSTCEVDICDTCRYQCLETEYE